MALLNSDPPRPAAPPVSHYAGAVGMDPLHITTTRHHPRHPSVRPSRAPLVGVGYPIDDITYAEFVNLLPMTAPAAVTSVSSTQT